MTYDVRRITKEAWAGIEPLCHSLVFGEERPAEKDRIDFALLVEQLAGDPMGYVTCREHDAETLYWQFGGVFPKARGTAATMVAFQDALGYCLKKYRRVLINVDNRNTVMLKMALNIGFSITGFRVALGNLLVELTKEA